MKPRMKQPTLLIALILSLAAFATAAESGEIVPPDDAAYQTVLDRADLVFPDLVVPHNRDYERPCIGNGFTGAQFSREENTIAVQIDRQDAYGPRTNIERVYAWRRSEPERRAELLKNWNERAGLPADHPRVPGQTMKHCPFGSLVIRPAGAIQSDPARIRLWDGVFASTITTDQGTLTLTAFTPESPEVMVLRIVATGEETAATIVYEPDIYLPGLDDLLARTTHEGDVQITVHPYNGEGDRTLAWTERKLGDGDRLVIASLDSGRFGPSREVALKKLEQARAMTYDDLLGGWQTYLRGEYRKHFLSFSDTKLESMYWIGIYRLIGQFHPEGTIADNGGIWTNRRLTGWERHLTNNMNAQSHWYPLFTANLAHRAAPFVRAVNENVHWFGHHRDRLTIGVWSKQTDLDYAPCRLSPESRKDIKPLHVDDVPMEFKSCPNELIEADHFGPSIANMSWRLQNYYRAYRMTMDKQAARRLFTLLKMNLRGHWMQMRGGKQDDGRYHMFNTVSPEFKHGGKGHRNAPYSTAAARWVCRTLIELDDRWGYNDPERERWVDIDKNLAPYPTAEGTFRDFDGAPPHGGHRHYSHLAMAWPYHVLDTGDTKNRGLLKASIEEMMTGSGMNPWSFAGLAPMAASIGDADLTYRALQGAQCWSYGQKQGNLTETPIMATMAVTQPVLQSYAGVIHVFPAVPDQWPDVVFHRMRAAGAFDVSAKRTEGKTRWIHITSDAGEPCRVQTDLARPLEAVGSRDFTLQDADGTVTIDLKRGESVLLKTKGSTIDTTIAPVEHDGWTNWWPEQRKQP